MRKKQQIWKVIALTLCIAMLTQMASYAKDTADAGTAPIKEKSKYTTTQLIVKYRDDADPAGIRQKVKQKTDNLFLAAVKKIKGKDIIEVIDVHYIDNMDKSIEAFEQQAGVLYAVPDYAVTKYGYTDETEFSQQWGLQNVGQTVVGQPGTAGIDINIIPAWETADGEGILIGVLDTGIDITHPDLAGNIFANAGEIVGNGIDDDGNGYIDDAAGWNFADDNPTIYSSPEEDTHGTNVAGIIASAANGTGIVGAAPKAQILPLKFIKGSTGYTSDAIEAISYAESLGVQIMDCSWGCAEYNFALKDAMENADMLFICAAGNDGRGGVSYPAAFGLSNVVSAGAIDNQGTVEDYSSDGAALDVYAPGTDILTTGCADTYMTVSGTSFASAYVTSIAALVRQSVPTITTAELKIAVKTGYTKKGPGMVRVADASEAIRCALPLNFIKDENGRLSRAMRYAGQIITPDVAEILTKFTQWSELDIAQKNTVIAFFGATSDEMDACLLHGLDIISSVIAELAAKRAGLSTNVVLSLLETYSNDNTFDNELESLKSVYDRINLTESEKTGIISLMQSGHAVIAIAKTLIIAETISCPVSDVISSVDDSYDFSQNPYTGEEGDSFINLVNTYNLDVQYILSYLTAQSLVPSQLTCSAFEWQQTNNFFVVENAVTPFSFAEPDLPGFNRYTATNGGAWGYGSASIDKATGLLSYSQPLISLAGRNGLGVSLGLRFDSEVCDAVIAGNETDRITYAYMVTENDQYYTLSGTRYPGMDTTCNYYYSNDSTIASWKAIDQTEEHIIGGYYYLRIITITAKTNSSVDASGLANFYDTRYNLGIGWAFDVPAVEIVNSVKFLHLPGGAKYKILGSNTLDGYPLNDITFGSATGVDFTVNGVAAAYALTDLDSNRIFFDVNGRYLGTKDLIGNRTQVYYDGNGMIDRIYDTAGRYLDLTYTTNAGVSRTVTVTLVDNDAVSPESVLLYTLAETYYTELDSIMLNRYLLTSITDARVDKTTSFDYNAYNSYIHYNNRSSYSIPTFYDRINSSIYMSGTTAPTGAYTSYSYLTKHMAYGPASERDYKRVSQILAKPYKTDYNPGDYRNVTSYTYANDNAYWRFQSNKIWPLLSATADNYCVTGDVKTVTTLNNELRATAQTTYQYSTGYAVSKSEVVAVNSFGLPTEVQTKTYKFDPGTSTYSTSSYTLEEGNYTWDSSGYGQQLTATTKSGSSYGMNAYNDANVSETFAGVSKLIPDNAVQYTTYDTNNFISGTDYYYAVKNVQTFDTATKKVHESTKSTYNMSAEPDTLVRNLSYTHYHYDSYGNVDEIVTKYAEGSDSLNLTTFANATVNQTVIAYDAKYGIYPASATVHDVLDCDGFSLKNAAGATVTDITTSTTYDLFGRAETATDGNGLTTEYAYTYSSTNHTMQTTTTYADDSAAQTTYYFAGNYSTTLNPDGTGSKTAYDVYGNVTDTYRLNSNGTSYDKLLHITYDSLMRPVTSIEYLNTAQTVYNTTTYTYDCLSRITDATVRNQSGTIIRQTQNTPVLGDTSISGTVLNSQKTTEVTGQTNNIISKDFSDAAGRTQKNYDYYTSTQYYTDTNNYNDYSVLSNSNINASTYYYEYGTDDAGRYMAIEYGTTDSYTSRTEYDGLSNEIGSIDPNGRTTLISYDILGRVIQVETPFDLHDSEIVYSIKKIYYDAGGRVVCEKQSNNAVGDTAAFTEKKNTYDSMGRVIKTELVLDANYSQFTQNYYDDQGRLRRVYTGLHEALTINGLDNVTTNGDTGYSVTKYTYDFYSRLSSYSNAGIYNETYQYYDLTGQLYIKTLRNDNTFTYTYDNSGNMTQLVGAQTGKTTLTHTFTYDKAGNVLTAADETTTTTYTYDAGSNCKTVAYSLGGDNYEVLYTYDGSNITSITFKKNTVQVDYQSNCYVDNGRISVSGNNNKYCVFTYDNNGNLTNQYANMGGTELSINYDYNYANQIKRMYENKFVSYSFVQGWQEDYTYRTDGNMTNKLYGTYPNADKTGYTGISYTDYTYDNLNRLETELHGTYMGQTQLPLWENSYTFDDYNNNKTVTYDDKINSLNDTTTTNTYSSNCKLTNQLIKHDTTTLHDYYFDYDLAGNLMNKREGFSTRMTYTYDTLNRMISSQPYGGSTTTYAYNAADQRLKKTTGSTTTTSMWADGRIYVDLTGSNKTVYLPNNFGVIVNDVLHSFALNAQGDVSAVLNTSTGVRTDYNFSAYGVKTSGGTLPSPISYRGYYTDSETGFFYLNARYYDPATQRFTQEDTYWGDGPNLYLYCSGNPVMFTDPTGHFGGRKMMLFEDRVSGRKVKTPAPTPEPISTPAPTPTKTPAGRPIPSSLEKHYKAPPAPNKRGEISLDGKKYENGKIPNSALVEVQKGIFLESDTAKDFIDMYKAAESGTVFDKRTGKEVRLNMVVFALSVGYRSYAVQEDLYNRRITDALPGQSMHGLGVAIDLTTSNGSIDTDGDGKVDIIGNLRFAEAQIPEVMWMEQHAHEFNFYPYLKSPLLVKSKQSFANGVDVFYYNEPWHWNHLP